MCCTVTVWLVETIWERFPFKLIKTNWLRRVVAFFGIIAIAWAMHFFLYFAQELTWGPAIRGTRRDFAPDWRWLHVGEMAVFFLVPALFLTFYCGNWPKTLQPAGQRAHPHGWSPCGGDSALHLLLQPPTISWAPRRASPPQQFPMIPTIWLINIWLVHHWFMDNWPAWKMVPKTAEEIAADHAAERRRLARSAGIRPGLGAGSRSALRAGLVYFITLSSAAVGL
jgi:amino acid transporter, AAT family